MRTHDIKLKATVTDEQIDDILVTAFEGGITYWCDAVRIKKGCEPKGDHRAMSDVLTRGGKLQLHDCEAPADEEWFTLTLAGLLAAFGKVDFNLEDYDANDADNLVQMALFGTVVYG